MDGSRKIRCQLEDVIVREALSVSNDSSLWRTITYLLVPEYIKRVDVKMIPKVVSLAMAILIVGTEEKDLLPHAFELLRSWESSGGAYRVVQEELARHAGIGLIERALSHSQNYSEVHTEWQNLSCSVFKITKINNLRLKQRLLLLKSEINGLISLGEQDSQLFKSIFDSYREEYNFKEKFLPWFSRWAHKLIRCHAQRFLGILEGEIGAFDSVNRRKLGGVPCFLYSRAESDDHLFREAIKLAFYLNEDNRDKDGCNTADSGCDKTFSQSDMEFEVVDVLVGDITAKLPQRRAEHDNNNASTTTNSLMAEEKSDDAKMQAPVVHPFSPPTSEDSPEEKNSIQIQIIATATSEDPSPHTMKSVMSLTQSTMEIDVAAEDEIKSIKKLYMPSPQQQVEKGGENIDLNSTDGSERGFFVALHEQVWAAFSPL